MQFSVLPATGDTDESFRKDKDAVLVIMFAANTHEGYTTRLKVSNDCLDGLFNCLLTLGDDLAKE